MIKPPKNIKFQKSHIQRAISGKAEHKKGGKQYELEKK